MATAPEIVASEPSSEALFEELLGEALESPDIANNLDPAHLSADELREEVAVRRDEIMRSCAPELDAYAGEFRNAGADRAELIALCEEIEKLATTRLPAVNLDAEGRTRRSSVLRMGLELACYGYFAATVLEVFHDGLTPAEIRLAADGTAGEPALEALAQAHAGFVVNPNTAWFGINSYRTTASCDPVIALSHTAIV